jgi:hypothetical protein
VRGYMDHEQLNCLDAELEAIALWDDWYVNSPHADAVDRDAFWARQNRRQHIVLETNRAAKVCRQPWGGLLSRGAQFREFTTE